MFDLGFGQRSDDGTGGVANSGWFTTNSTAWECVRHCYLFEPDVRLVDDALLIVRI
jgi:hypothetical protein